MKEVNVCIVQARLGSSRFPKKILQPLWNDLTVIDVLIERLKLCKSIDHIVIATTTNPLDNELEAHIKTRYWADCGANKLSIYRGSEEDVLGRVTDAFLKVQADNEEWKINALIDITSDCPFVDIEMIEIMVDIYKTEDYDYLSNIMARGYPVGYDVQIYKPYLLEYANEISIDKNHRMHVGWNMINYSRILQIRAASCSVIIKYGNYHAGYTFRPDWRIVVDYPEDLELLKRIIVHWDCIDFGIGNVIGLLQQKPELLEINKNCKQKIAGTDKLKELQ